jgi:SNF2 family N-terminal domain
MLDLQSFDSWIGMFAERVTEFEVDIDTSTYRLATRFAKFHNLPELTSLLSSVADFHQVDESADIPAFDGYNDALVSKTPAFAAYLADISTRADDVRNRRISRKDDNMLKIVRC